MIETWRCDESFAAAFHRVVGCITKTLQVVMSEGRTPGRHDGRDAEVRRFAPFPLHRHPLFFFRFFIFLNIYFSSISPTHKIHQDFLLNFFSLITPN